MYFRFLWMTSCFHIVERIDQNQRRRVCFVQFTRWRTWCKICILLRTCGRLRGSTTWHKEDVLAVDQDPLWDTEVYMYFTNCCRQFHVQLSCARWRFHSEVKQCKYFYFTCFSTVNKHYFPEILKCMCFGHGRLW